MIEKARSLPQTSTKTNLLEIEGIRINGSFLPDAVSSRSAILVAFDDFKAKLLKIPADICDAQHELDFWGKICTHTQNPRQNNLLDFYEKVTLSKPIVEVGNLSHTSEKPVSKIGMLMPLYPTTLKNVPNNINEVMALQVWDQVSTALDFIHQIGFTHCDVKSSNIFIDMDGKMVLGDYGATTEIDREPREGTCPYKLEDQNDIASAHNDYTSLCLTVLEKIGFFIVSDVAAKRNDVLQALSKVQNDMPDLFTKLAPYFK